MSDILVVHLVEGVFVVSRRNKKSDDGLVFSGGAFVQKISSRPRQRSSEKRSASFHKRSATLKEANGIGRRRNKRFF